VLITIITALLFPNLYFPMIFLLRFSKEVSRMWPLICHCVLPRPIATPTTSMTRFYTFSRTVLFEFLVKFSAWFG